MNMKISIKCMVCLYRLIINKYWKNYIEKTRVLRIDKEIGKDPLHGETGSVNIMISSFKHLSQKFLQNYIKSGKIPSKTSPKF